MLVALSLPVTPIHPLDAVLFNATAIYKRRNDTQRRRRPPEGFPRTNLQSRADLFGSSTFPCFYLPHEGARGTREWTRRIRQRKHTALLLSSDPFVRARRDYLRNEKHSSCRCCCYCWETSCFYIDTFRLCVYWTCIISASLGETF